MSSRAGNQPGNHFICHITSQYMGQHDFGPFLTTPSIHPWLEGVKEEVKIRSLWQAYLHSSWHLLLPKLHPPPPHVGSRQQRGHCRCIILVMSYSDISVLNPPTPCIQRISLFSLFIIHFIFMSAKLLFL